MLKDGDAKEKIFPGKNEKESEKEKGKRRKTNLPIFLGRKIGVGKICQTTTTKPTRQAKRAGNFPLL